LVTGLRARGGFEIDLSWTAGKLTLATVKSLNGHPVQLRLGTEMRNLTIGRGASYRWQG